MTHPIQIILIRQLAGYLSVPVFLIDPKGNLLFYNEPAEIVLGRRFQETGPMPTDEWSTVFTPLDDEGQPFPPENLPQTKNLVKYSVALKKKDANAYSRPGGLQALLD
jgi:hypothetical protein